VILSPMKRSLIIGCIVLSCLLPCIAYAAEDVPQETEQTTQQEEGAIVLQFDWNTAYRLADLKASDFQPPGGPSNPAFFTARIKGSWSLIPYMDRPEKFAHVVKEVEITLDMLQKMKMAGVNPYQIIGIVSECNHT